MHARPLYLELAAKSGAWWGADSIELVAETGGADHLRPRAEEAGLIANWSLDIAIFATLLLAIPLLLRWK